MNQITYYSFKHFFFLSLLLKNLCVFIYQNKRRCKTRKEISIMQDLITCVLYLYTFTQANIF
jgi:hypothetical protein